MNGHEQNETKGRCITCGFLCRRDLINTHLSAYYEITKENREGARFFSIYEHHAPSCFRGAAQILDEIQAITGVYGIPRAENDESVAAQSSAASAVVHQNRQCPSWFAYTPGLGPKEHLEEFRIQQIEDDRKAFEMRLFEKEQQSQERWQKVGFWLAVAAVVLALAQVLTMTEESFLWRGVVWIAQQTVLR